MRKSILFRMAVVGFSISTIALAQAPDSTQWATATPESQGLAGEALDTVAEYALQYGGGSGCVVRGGRLVKEWGDPAYLADIKSATKGSFGVTCLGLAVDRGLVELDEKAREYYPDLGSEQKDNASTGWLDEIAVRHLATMTAGFDDGRPPRLVYRPGTGSIYSNDGSNMLAELLTLQFGEDLAEVVRREVLHPIGVGDADWRWRDNSYRSKTVGGIKSREFASGIRITHRALARIGQLYLNKGTWDGRSILSESFIEEATRPTGLPAYLPGDEGPYPVAGMKTNHRDWGWDSQAKTEEHTDVQLRRRGVFIDVDAPGEHIFRLGSRAPDFKIDRVMLIHTALDERPDESASGQTATQWPGAEWPRGTAEAAGLVPSKVAGYLSWLAAKAGGKPYGTVLVRQGNMVVDHYGSGATRESAWEIGSLRKAVGSALLGMAVHEGRLALDTPVYKVWPEILLEPEVSKNRTITVRQLFNSTSGWKRPEAAGTQWVYSNSAFTAGGMVVGRAYDLPDDRIASLAMSRIAEPIGALDWNCYHYPQGFSDSYGDPGPKLAIDSTLEDLARFGYLWLRQGEWNGRQIIPKSYVAEATRNQAAAAGGHYGYCWFVNDGKVLLPNAPEDTFFHVGNGKDNRRTVLAVVPSLDIVASVGTDAEQYDITSGYKSQPVPHVNDWMGTILDCFDETDTAFSFPTFKPEDVGMVSSMLEEAKQYALTGGGSGCILRHGRAVMAWGDQNEKYDLFSSTKSIGITALGLALMDGKVALDDKAKDHLTSVGVPPEENAGTGWLDDLTLWHLATQTGGFEKTRGWCRQLNAPGSAWTYSDGGPNWLADCLTMAYGRDLLEVMNERVFQPLGITVGDTPTGGEHDLHWGFNNLDRPHQLNGINRRPFGAGIHANVDAMAKIGYLYLRRGQWRGKQILPEPFVDRVHGMDARLAAIEVKDDMLSSAGASRHYGLLWWNNNDGAMEGVPHDAYWSWGMKESFIIVVPSLDLVAVRAGDFWAPREDPKRADAYNNILKPFLLPICESVVDRAPYPQSKRIPRIEFSDLILDRDRGGPDYASGDQWAGTWANDGNLYMGWGDGTGFGHRGNWRDPVNTFMGLARIEGTPPNHKGFNVWGGHEPESETGALYVNRSPQPLNLKPADGLVAIDDTLYLYAERKSDGRVDCHVLTSRDYGRTWEDYGRFFQEDGKFAFTGIIQFGQNRADAPESLGDYLYLYDGGTKAETNAHFKRKDMLLARIPLNDLLSRQAVEFFSGTADQPAWTASLAEAKPVFSDPQGVNSHVSCTYIKAIGRYFLLTMHSSPGDKEGFGIFESERPWGPWSTVYYTDHLDDFVPGLELLISLSLPSKWISPDGKTMWLVFSGRPSEPFYSFNVIKIQLETAEEK